MALAIKDNPPSKTFNCPVSEKEGSWWVANVMSKHEKTFSFDMMDMQIDYFLPFVEKKTILFPAELMGCVMVCISNVQVMLKQS